MDVPVSTLDVLRRIAGHIDAFESTLAREGVRTHTAAHTHDALLKELKAMRAALEAHAAAATTGGSAPHTVEGLRGELRRSNEAYAAAVRESRAAKAAAAAREKELSADLARARATASQAATMKSEHTQALAAAKALREKLDAATSANNVLRTRLEEKSRAAEREAAAAASMRERLAALKDAEARVAASVKEAAGLQARVAGLETQLEDARRQTAALTAERDAMADYALENMQALTEARTALQGSLSGIAAQETANAALAAAHAQLQRQHEAMQRASERQRELERENSDLHAQLSSASDAAVRLREAEAVQGELLQTITALSAEAQQLRSQAGDAAASLSKSKEELTLETRRSQRLERALASYKRVEDAFMALTGRRFFGLDGLDAALPARATRESALTDESPLLEGLLERLRQRMREEVQQEVARAADDASERAHVRREDDAAKIRAQDAVIQELNAALVPLQQLQRDIQRANNHAADAVKLVDERRPTARTAQVDAAATALREHAPELASLLQHTSESSSTALRRQRVVSSELHDLQDEVTMLRAKAADVKHARDSAVTELRAALLARQQEHKIAVEETARVQRALEQREAELAAEQQRVERYKDRVRRAKSMLSEHAEQEDSLRSRLRAAETAYAAMNAQRQAWEVRFHDLERMHERALKLLRERDDELTTLRLQPLSHQTPTSVRVADAPARLEPQRSARRDAPKGGRASATSSSSSHITATASQVVHGAPSAADAVTAAVHTESAKLSSSTTVESPVPPAPATGARRRGARGNRGTSSNVKDDGAAAVSANRRSASTPRHTHAPASSSPRLADTPSENRTTPLPRPADAVDAPATSSRAVWDATLLSESVPATPTVKTSTKLLTPTDLLPRTAPSVTVATPSEAASVEESLSLSPSTPQLATSLLISADTQSASESLSSQRNQSSAAPPMVHGRARVDPGPSALYNIVRHGSAKRR